MLKSRYLIIITLILTLLSACTGKDEQYALEITNTLDRARHHEIVEVSKADLDGILCEVFTRLGVKDLSTGEFLPSQLIDLDMNGEMDILIFQPAMEAGETLKFQLIPLENPPDYSALENRTFSRFVPERTDDYAWENDRVAFRTYGPTAQKMIEENIKGGTLSSGMDCWLKRVKYPIIDKWYKKTTEKTGSYHKDTGEGLDDFHVGPSRGCGGIGIWNEEEKKLYTSRNFSDWRTVAEGPLRTRFELDYIPWEYPGGMFEEQKIISLDMGSNLMRIEIKLSSDSAPESITAGITLHENDGLILVDESAGWFSYWQPHGDSELGMGIVVEPKYLLGYSEHFTEEKDQSHLLMHMKPINGSIVYYAGFGWLKNSLFSGEQDWIEYLDDFAGELNSPLIVNVY